MICRFVFSGTGGQGIITAAILISETAVYFDHLNAVQTQSYGPEARGGSARADVIISSERINFPKVVQPNILICLNQESYDKYNGIVRPGGVIVSDLTLVKRRKNPDARQMEIPLQDTVLKELGSTLPLNIAVLGALARILDFVQLQSLEKTVEKKFKGTAVEMNKKALALGYSLTDTLYPNPPIEFY